MNIFLGCAPDFAMKIGKLEIFHRVNVFSCIEAGIVRESSVFADRSLWNVSKMARSYLVRKIQLELNAIDFNSYEYIEGFVIQFHKARIVLVTPKELLRCDKVLIQEYFRLFFKIK